MTDPSTGSERALWQARQVYVLSAVCLLAGLICGYLFRGSASPAAARAATTTSSQPADVQSGQGMPSLDQMKHMADKQAEPLLARVQNNPKDADALMQLGRIYQMTHQFKEAEGYYEKAVQAEPGNVAGRTALASCLYYTGDADAAISQLHQALQHDSKNPDALFNLGVMLQQAKKDNKGAVTTWKRLLKSNPGLESGKKAQVEKLIADASRITTNSSVQ